ncbi:MAG: NUDIX domain-containing protein [Candidatus Aenigmarchaeota archaeon]|nr:NUDIX domain-containing protein [Candidatus Aenigmarchaeota archaeon]
MKNRITCGGVVSREGKIVLCFCPDGRDWQLPQGGKRKGETFLAGARREIREETGLRGLELVKFLGVVRRMNSIKTKMKIIHIYLFRTQNKILKPHDSDKPKWFVFEKAVKINSYPAEKAFLRKHKNVILNAWKGKL